MGGFIEPSISLSDKRDWRPVIVGVVFVVVIVGAVIFFLRPQPKVAAAPDPYAANLKLSGIKMSVAQNFVGTNVTYIDGTMTNMGDRTMTRAVLHVVFRDSLNQVTQVEDQPLKVLQTSGPYPDAVDFSTAPLAPGQSKQFRLIFEHISAEWNQAYPELQVMQLSLK